MVLEIANIGKSYRNYSSQLRRIQGWLTGAPRGYQDHWVLRGFSFAANPGESIGILGRNGAGKSTLLKIITGTLQPTEGSVTVRGRISAILELGMGFNLEFTARENVMHACGLMGFERNEILEMMPNIERFSDIGSYFDQPLRTFSSGMQMRVAFAAATAFRPDILLIDEALAVGDLSFQAKCFERISALIASGTTLLYVSHSVQDVLKHCERALYIKNGLLVLDGPSREVSNEYLDDMFGRERQQDEAKPVLRHGGMPKFDRGNIEQFSIRPYYRKEEYRWGNGYARILDYQLQVNGREFPAVFYTHQELRIAFKVHFEREIGRPVFGLLIKTYDGVYLYGTNSQLAKRDGRPQHVSADEVQVAVFDFPLVLNAGAYLISVGVSEEQDQGELVPLDRRYDAILITVVNESAGSGLLDLGAVFHLNAVE